MNAKTFLGLLVVAGLAIWGAWTTFNQPDTKIPRVGEIVVDKFTDKINEVAAIEVFAAGEKFNIARTESGWSMTERDNYPANPSVVREFLIGISEFSYREPKTSSPELYSKLGLADPSKSDGTAVKTIVKTGSGDVLAELTMGDRRPSRGDPSKEEIFVLVGDDPQAWVVQGKIPFSMGKPMDWLDKQVVKLADERIANVTLKHSDGARVEVYKLGSKDIDFKLKDLKDEHKLKDAWRVNDIGKVLADVEFEDVSANTDGELALEVQVRTFDGMKVNGRGLRRDDKMYLTLEAQVDESAPKDNSANEGDDKSTALKDGAEVAKNVEQLNSRWKGWAFQLPKWKVDYLSRKYADLVEDKDAAAAESAESEGLPALPGAGSSDSLLTPPTPGNN